MRVEGGGRPVSVMCGCYCCIAGFTHVMIHMMMHCATLHCFSGSQWTPHWEGTSWPQLDRSSCFGELCIGQDVPLDMSSCCGRLCIGQGVPLDRSSCCGEFCVGQGVPLHRSSCCGEHCIVQGVPLDKCNCCVVNSV